MKDRYQEEIVDWGDKTSERASETCLKSYDNNRAVNIIPRRVGDFRGPIDFVWMSHILSKMMSGKMRMNLQNDGAGEKPQFFTIIGTEEVFRRLGWEIVTMVIDDQARAGGFPAVFANDVNVKKVTEQNFHLVEAMFDGMDEILRSANLVNITGEFAIMKHSVTAFCDMNLESQLILNWAGAGIGLIHEDKVIDGSKIGIGMPIVGFWEPGYRCNGGTRFTELILSEWGKGDLRNIWNSPDAMEFIEKLTIPSQSYAKTWSRINGWTTDGRPVDRLAEMVGIAHLTGGGLKKLKELLPPGVGANLRHMPKPADVLLEAQNISFKYPELWITDESAHTTFHGGCGAMAICYMEEDAEIVIREAEKDGIDASIVGYTVPSDSNTLTIDSKFLEGKKNMII